MSALTQHGPAAVGGGVPAPARSWAGRAGRRAEADPPPADAVLGPLLPAVAARLATVRGYRGPGAAGLRPYAVTVVHEGTADLVVAVVAERGRGVRHQLLLGVGRELPARLRAAALGTVDHGPWAGRRVYDAVADPALMGVLLRALAARRVPGLHLEPATLYPLPVGLVPRPLSGGPDNTAVVYGDRLLLRLHRSPSHGPDPESDVLRALAGQDCPRTPRLYGTLYTDVPGRGRLPLGLIEEFVPGAEDGRHSALRYAHHHLADSSGGTGGFTPYAHALGQAVAEVHLALGRAFPRRRMSPVEVAEDVFRMRRRLAEAVAEVPQLARSRSRLAAVFDEYGRQGGRGGPVAVQRTHGGLHLGRTLYAEGGWRVVGFDGDPAAPVAERALAQPALRDVAGILRSFDQAAHTVLRELGDPDASGAARVSGARGEPADIARHTGRRHRAAAWSLGNRRAFCAGYTSAGGEDPSSRTAQLDAFEADLSVREALHRARVRTQGPPGPPLAGQRFASAVR
ncbi:hypothetical protein ACFV0T_27915 [Streptomyces sp. NPDC059582]|uniref:maltokinase N-terminal cap-like domain-containing protein n=1 Tax=Streptomyces sp. NPDC059582 TaxID=3346875 RepID=UPI00368A7F13